MYTLCSKDFATLSRLVDCVRVLLGCSFHAHPEKSSLHCDPANVAPVPSRSVTQRALYLSPEMPVVQPDIPDLTEHRRRRPSKLRACRRWQQRTCERRVQPCSPHAPRNSEGRGPDDWHCDLTRHKSGSVLEILKRPHRAFVRPAPQITDECICLPGNPFLYRSISPAHATFPARLNVQCSYAPEWRQIP